MMDKQSITEEMGIHKEWYVEAKNITAATLPEFIAKLTNDYNHDYGTICHACTAAAIAAAAALNASDQGGITGFQAGAVMWEFIQHWMSKDGPMRLLEYGDMLYPQYADKFDKFISPRTAEWLKEQAEQRLADRSGAHPNVVAHWQKIASGALPFGYQIRDD